MIYPGLSRSGYLRRRQGLGPAIVTYHGVLPAGYRGIDSTLDGSLISAETLRRQIRLLQRDYQVISPDRFREWCEGKRDAPPRAVLLTCDDGLQNVLTDMLPVLQECSVQCLFFVTGGSLHDARSVLWYEELYLMLLSAPQGCSFTIPELGLPVAVSTSQSMRGQWWELVKQMSRYDRDTRQQLLEEIRIQLGLADIWMTKYLSDAGLRRFGLLTPLQVRGLMNAGMTIGAHTLSHPMLSLTPEEAAHDEISQNLEQISHLLGRQVWAFAYPFGDSASVSARELRLAEQAGFSCAFMNGAGGFGAEMPRFALPRVHVTAEMSLAEFEAHVSGFYRDLRRRFAGRDENLAISVQGAENGCQ